jgi:hypothetical protein
MKKTTRHKPKAKHIDFDVAILKRDPRDNYLLIVSVICATGFSFFLGYLVGKTDEAVQMFRPPVSQINVDQAVSK